MYSKLGLGSGKVSNQKQFPQSIKYLWCQSQWEGGTKDVRDVSVGGGGSPRRPSGRPPPSLSGPNKRNSGRDWINKSTSETTGFIRFPATGEGAIKSTPETTGFIRGFACSLGQAEGPGKNTRFYKGFRGAPPTTRGTKQRHKVL